jgi:hypothetical protein
MIRSVLDDAICSLDEQGLDLGPHLEILHGACQCWSQAHLLDILQGHMLFKPFSQRVAQVGLASNTSNFSHQHLDADFICNHLRNMVADCVS